MSGSYERPPAFSLKRRCLWANYHLRPAGRIKLLRRIPILSRHPARFHGLVIQAYSLLQNASTRLHSRCLRFGVQRSYASVHLTRIGIPWRVIESR